MMCSIHPNAFLISEVNYWDSRCMNAVKAYDEKPKTWRLHHDTACYDESEGSYTLLTIWEVRVGKTGIYV